MIGFGVVFGVAVFATNGGVCSAARRGAARGGRATAAQRDAEVVQSAFECDLPRGVRVFGSRERCLRELCERRDVTNAYVRDRRDRLRANPCAGLDPFDLR